MSGKEPTFKKTLLLPFQTMKKELIDKSEFEAIKKRFEEEEERRERVLKESRQLLKLSKQAIYNLHRGEEEKAAAALKRAEEIKERLEKENKEGSRTGSQSAALAEYAEAKTFHSFLTTRRIARMNELGVAPEEYLAGLADLTGEVARRAVIAATRKEKEEVERIYDLIEELHGCFTTFDFRNGELRRKYDSIKYALQKVEQLRYDLSRR